MIKKILDILMKYPSISNLLKKAFQTGRLDPFDTLGALSALSPSTKKVADTAINTAQNSNSISDVAKVMMNIGEIEIDGKKLNTRTMIKDLKNTGGICSMLGNILEQMQNQSTEDIAKFGNAASNLDNWKDIAKHFNTQEQN